ncbi:MAG: hypothetical protein Q4Q22_01890 [Methanosphaera sp.]|nr:hypothetical protein [Methanosphaera sp.]
MLNGQDHNQYCLLKKQLTLKKEQDANDIESNVKICYRNRLDEKLKEKKIIKSNILKKEIY